MNKHDAERVAGMLEGQGCLPVGTYEEADIVVFMTCCVREAADVRLMGQVASMKNLPLRKGSSTGKRVVAVGGCIGQRDGEKLAQQLPHIDVVFGTYNLQSLPRLIASSFEDSKHHIEVLDGPAGFSTDLPSDREKPWAAWLPIIVGCDNFCSYCIVPSVRGREKSRPLEDVIEEAKGYVASGVKEITLLGQNVNSYGRDLYGQPRFYDVLEKIDSTGIARLRFATSHPKDLTQEVIGAFGALPSLMPAIHLPIQSGSNRILSAMNRGYTQEHYLGLIEALKTAAPGIALSTDVIVGFPGESESDFEQTCKVIEEVGYTQVFTFIYSRREGTPAAKMHDETPPEVVQERFDRLVAIVQRQAWAQNQKDVGTVVEVLVEGASKRNPQLITGKSPKNQTVHAKFPDGACDLTGSFVKVAVKEAKTWYLLGDIVDGGAYGRP
ncbi:MAG: tRNA (N6-isopentenyl adenosine(37)-C2)-methylthiotransferase MiaB [Eggerthellaceae bacterium]|nr:tRNA (N6-isopentenyl adenosine(37)-C2)-methylthiotransferase MiaB [Eggerthellaceae bacterium]